MNIFNLLPLHLVVLVDIVVSTKIKSKIENNNRKLTVWEAPPDRVDREFPFLQFFNLSDPSGSKQLDKQLRDRFSCKGLKKCCTCTEVCMKYGTCCIDYIWKQSTGILQEYLTLMMSQKSKFQNVNLHLECLEAFPEVSAHGHQSVKYQMVASCPRNTSKEEKDLCRNEYLGETRVLGRDGFIYKNHYCARCNGQIALRMLNYTVKCKSYTNIASSYFHEDGSSTKLRNCTFDGFISPTSGPYITNQCQYQKKCENKSSTSSIYCDMYKAPVLGYKNIHCAECDSRSVAHALENPKCVSINTGHGGFTWSLFIQVYLAESESSASFYDPRKGRLEIATSRCKNASVDLLTAKCVNFSQENRMKPDSAFYQACGNVIDDWFVTRVNDVFLVMGNSLLSKVLAVMNGLLGKETYVLVEPQGNHINKLMTHAKSFVRMLKTSYSLFKPLLNDSAEIVLSPYNVVVSSKEVGWRYNRVFPGWRLCQEYVNQGNVSTSCNTTNIPVLNTSFSISITRNKTSLNMLQCKKFYSKSSCVSQNSVPYFSRKTILKLGYRICKDNLYIILENINRVDGYISFYGTSTSVVCYAFSMTTFKLFPSTMPCGIFCLCVSLILSDTLFVIIHGLYTSGAVIEPHLCKTLAVIMHWLLLTGHACAVMSALDIAIRFGIVNTNRSTRSWRKYLRNRAPALLVVPVVVILIALTMDYLGVVKMGYDSDNLCLFTGFYGRFYFFIIPTVIYLTISTPLLIFTIVKISREISQNRRQLEGSSSQHSRSVGRTAVKLILAYGIIEVVGFVQVANNGGDSAQIVNTVFAMLHNTLRSIRGVLIFAVYICKRSVYQLYKEYIFGEQQNEAAPPNDVSTRMKSQSTDVRKVNDESAKTRRKETVFQNHEHIGGEKSDIAKPSHNDTTCGSDIGPKENVTSRSFRNYTACDNNIEEGKSMPY